MSRRLAQNREAARKSRIKKKVVIFTPDSFDSFFGGKEMDGVNCGFVYH
jgi:hypothetical protein